MAAAMAAILAAITFCFRCMALPELSTLASRNVLELANEFRLTPAVFTKVSHLSHSYFQGLAGRGAERNAVQLVKAEPDQRRGGAGWGFRGAHLQPVVVMGDRMADLSQAAARRRQREIPRRRQVPEPGHALLRG